MSGSFASNGMIDAYRQTEQLLRRALEKNPESSDLLAQLGRCVALQGKTEEALEFFLSSLEADPAQPGVLLRTGDLYLAMRCYEEAMRFYQHYESLRPESARGFARMGDCLLAQGLPWCAADAYSLALDRDPRNPKLEKHLTDLVERCIAED